jgi:phosphatidylinositol-4,5-bisphosphate 3-kinase
MENANAGHIKEQKVEKIQEVEVKKEKGKKKEVLSLEDEEKLKEEEKRKDEQKKKSNTSFLVIFKCDDDIRQDLLTLQLIKVMDKLWLDQGIDFRMKPYRVLATKDQVGMIEVVLNSETTSAIHHEGGLFGPLKDDTIWNYIKQNN